DKLFDPLRAGVGLPVTVNVVYPSLFDCDHSGGSVGGLPDGDAVIPSNVSVVHGVTEGASVFQTFEFELNPARKRPVAAHDFPRCLSCGELAVNSLMTQGGDCLRLGKRNDEGKYCQERK
ncbi:MAG: hypothetical protein ACRELG_00765, partial [Gemmataceae bacterium]